MSETHMWRVLLVSVLLPSLCLSQFSDVEDIRLTGGEDYGNHTGRLEALINGTWAALCQRNYNNAKVACKVLGFPWAVCTIPYSDPYPLGTPANDTVIWEDPLVCSGNEDSINECGTRTGTCTELTQVLCQDYNVFKGRATNLTLTEASSTTVTVEWTIPEIPILAERIRHRVFVKEDVNGAPRSGNVFVKNFLTRSAVYRPQRRKYSVVIHTLPKNSSFHVQIRTDIRYLCSGSFGGGFMQSRPSQSLRVTTAEKRKISQLPIRLVPPAPGVDFIGRVEVYYNNTWGTVCDDNFQSPEARVVCQSLNFTGALCHVREAGLGQGEGPIWLDNVDCSRGHEVLEDCDRNDWGVNNCDHGADIGVVCVSDDHHDAVRSVTVQRVGATSITLSWEAFSFPALSTNQRYNVQYYSPGVPGRQTLNVAGDESTTTIPRLTTGLVYTARIRAQYSYSYCTQSISGDYSDPVQATTVVTAPDGPPTAFHVLPINNTALEFQWDLPGLEVRNGPILGYKLYVQPLGEDEMEIIIPSNTTTNYILAGLSPSTVYTCSVLAYTSDDGPRSVYLTVITPDEDFVPIISGFGVNGNGLDRGTVWPGDSDIRIHCDVSDLTIAVTWYDSEGNPVGTTDRNLRQVSYNNGTTVLQIASNREVTYCDAGVYTCVANTTRSAHQRDFTLLFSDVPPRPSVPAAVRVTSSAVVLGWDELDCNGGHTVTGFTIRYRKTYQDFLTSVNMYVYNLDPSLRNYTIVNLEPYTSYNFSVRAISDEFQPSEFSLENIITTLAEGPSPPRRVAGVVSGPNMVDLTWTTPAEPNGIITSYIVHVFEVEEPVVGGGPSGGPVPTATHFTMTFSGSTGAATIAVPVNSAYYGFQVSATTSIGNDVIEGEKSEVVIVYVPNPAIPVVRNVRRLLVTNSSIALTWTYPSESFEEILGFQVTITGEVEAKTRSGFLLIFTESFVKNCTAINACLFTALTPGTAYIAEVAVLTRRGQGATVLSPMITTEQAFGVDLVYFQLMIGPVQSCVLWQEDSSTGVTLHTATLEAINTVVCPTCNLNEHNIRDHELSCRGVENDQQIIFRARMIGNDRFSAENIVDMLSVWVSGGDASLSVNSARLGIEPFCETVLDRPEAADCSLMIPTTASPTTMPATTISVTTAPETQTDEATTVATTVMVIVEQAVGLRPGDIGGLIIGVVIAVLLMLFIALLIVLLFKLYRRNDFRMRRLEEDKVINEGMVTSDNPVFKETMDPKKENDYM